jgi:hypothetical protein
MALGFGWFPNEPEPFANSHLAGAAFVNELAKERHNTAP